MNLLILIFSLSCGGAERVTANLANHWAAKGWSVTIVTLAPLNQDFYDLHPSIKRIALNLAGESQNLINGLVNNIKRVAILRRILRENSPNIALGMMSGANVILCLAAAGIPNMSVIGSERVYPPMFPLGRLWEQLRSWTYRRANWIILQTSGGLEWLKQEIPKARGAIIPNPLYYPLPVSKPVLAPENWLDSDRKVLLAVGRLTEQKGFESLIRVFAKLAPTNNEWDLVILGEGELRYDLESVVKALEMEDRVYLPGRAGNLGDWYARADLFVMSSRFEGFPNALVEAMAYECAVVSFDCATGPRDIVRHGVDGLLVPAGHLAEFKAAVLRLMSHDDLRRQMAGRAIDVRERYSMAKVVGIWEELFERVEK